VEPERVGERPSFVKVAALAVTLVALAVCSPAQHVEVLRTPMPQHTRPARKRTNPTPNPKHVERAAYIEGYGACRLKSPAGIARHLGWDIENARAVADRFSRFTYSSEASPLPRIDRFARRAASAGCLDAFRGRPKRPRQYGNI
jgi:hypothetical protein